MKIHVSPCSGCSSETGGPLLAVLQPLHLCLRYTGVTVPMACEGVPEPTRFVFKMWSLLFRVKTILYIVRHFTFMVTAAPADQWAATWPLHVIILVFYVSTVSTSTVFLYQTWTPGSCLDQAFLTVGGYDGKYGVDEVTVEKQRRVVKRITIVTTISTIVVCLSLLINAYLPGSREIFEPIMLWPLHGVYGLVYVCVLYHITAVGMYGIVYVSVLCWLIKQRFNKLNGDVEDTCTANTTAFIVEQIRHRFSMLTEGVSAVDKFVGPNIGIILFIYIPFACFTLYRTVLNVRHGRPTVEIVVIAAWMVASVTMVTLMISSAACFHNTIHHLKHVVYKSLRTARDKLQWNDNSRMIELLLLVDQLNDEEIGATIFGLYVVTKDTASAILSVYVTYIILTLQMLS